MPLDAEQQTYERELESLLKSFGKYAVICGSEIAGTYDTFNDALSVGYDRFGLTPFMVKQIGVDEAIRFSRPIFV